MSFFRPSPGFSWLAFSLAAGLAACGGGGGDDDDGATDPDAGSPLDPFLPEIPAPTGDAPSVFAGTIDAANAAQELIPGDAASGAVGDLYLRNARGRYVIQAAERVIGVVPQGGNLVDAQPIGPDGPIGEDQFGELSAVYLLGRTCEHSQIEVLQDGSGGGVAAIRARGKTAVNDYINLKGIGIPFDASLDPDIPDSMECATTYLLAPDSPVVDVYWTFYNGGSAQVSGPFGMLNDTGGNTDIWAPAIGFAGADLNDLTSGGPAPIEYAVYQAPNVAYGVIPVHSDPATRSASVVVSGVSVILYGADEFFDVLGDEGIYLELAPGDGVTQSARFGVGTDAADIEELYLAGTEQESRALAGQVTWSDSAPARARVGVFEDVDGDQAIGGEDRVVTYMDTDAEGRFSGLVRPGSYLFRADVPSEARSAVVAGDGDGEIALRLDRPVRYDYRVVDDETSAPVPAKLLVVGNSPAAPDERVHPTGDTVAGVVDMIHAIHGTSVNQGDGADPAIFLPPGSDYRILVTRGTEWTPDETLVSPVAGEDPPEIGFLIRRVIETEGYLASEYHVHSIGSPDSKVDWRTRVATAAADGVELFASTEHDYVADLQPVVEELGLASWVRVLPGIEVTPFVYGHFNAWPLVPDRDSPNRGAIDWARGAMGFALTPGEIFDAMFARGAKLVEVNHPRTTGGLINNYQQYFDRADLTFDYENRSIFGNSLGQPVSNESLRLPPGESLLDLSFNALEVWNGFRTADTDEDGVREIQSLDLVMRDWFHFLSFGLAITPIGNSDTHTAVRDPMGMPRTLVAVPDDTAEALVSGSVVEPLIQNLAGEGTTPRDVVVTNGPFLRVTQTGGTGGSVIGRTLTPIAGQVQLDIAVQSPPWAEFDVIEVFVNATPEQDTDVTSLRPALCFVTVLPDTLDPNDPCASAPLGARVMSVTLVSLGGSRFRRFEAEVSALLADDDLIHPEGGTGRDAWVVVRVRGKVATYPMLLEGIVSEENAPTLVAGDTAAVRALLLAGGVPASAFTAPIYLDFDGGGYRAPFAPK